MIDPPVDIDLLRVIAKLAMDTGAAGTDSIADAKCEADRAAGRNAQRTSRAPYFGLDGPIGELENAGYISGDPGVASLVAPGAATPGHA